MIKLSIFFTVIFCMQNAFGNDQKPYKVFLKPGTIITKLSDKKDYKLERGIYANVLETSPSRRDNFMIYNKDGIATYSTTAWGIVEIAKDIQLLPDMDAQLTYPAPSVFKKNNTHASFDTQLNVYFDNLDTHAFNHINGQDFTGFSLGNRFELRTLYASSLPVNFGFAMSYEVAKWANEIENLELSIVSIGPHLQKTIFEEDDISVSFLAGAEYAPIYTTTSNTGKDKYNAMILDVGAEILWSGQFGKWSLGAHYRRHDLVLTSTTRADVTPIPEHFNSSSIGAMLGYKYEWDL